MRLQQVEVSGFRGFASQRVFDVDADSVVIVGANGNGKTSFFDAVLWGLSGRVPRLSEDDARLMNRFSETGLARVRLTLGTERNVPALTVTRTFDGKESKLAVEMHEEPLRGPEAEGKLIRTLWRDAAGASDPSETLCNVLTRSVYLQQDLVRQFIDSVSEQERFLAVSELVGAGRITDLQSELERSKLAWTRFTNAKAAEIEPLRGRLDLLTTRLQELEARQGDGEGVFDERDWISWLSRAKECGAKVSESDSSVGIDAKSSLDRFIKNLESLRRALERKVERLDVLSVDIQRLNAISPPNLEDVKGRYKAQAATVASLQAKADRERERLGKMRAAQAALKEHADQMRTLAAIALKNLGDHCPVCVQTYDVEVTRHRLELLANLGGDAIDIDESSFLEIMVEVSNAQGIALRTQMEIRSVEQAIASYESLRGFVTKGAKELGLDGEVSEQALSAMLIEAKCQIANVEAVQRDGEAISLRLSRASDASAVSEILSEIENLKIKLEVSDREIALRNRTGSKAQRIIEALRESASDVVADKISELQPLLTDMYSRVDVHPAFRVVKFLTSIVRGKGRLSTLVCDPTSNVEVDMPNTVLSSSQLNALAVCTFLSLNLGLARTPLDSLMLDDPLQSLDDINLLGLIDLLRQAKERRQLILSTHDVRFGVLLGRKLRPANEYQRTVVIELDGWGRGGPDVTMREIGADPSPIRLRAVAG